MYWSPSLHGSGARHIGIVLDQFSTGGTERVAIRLGNAWATAGRAVTIFCGSAEGPVRDLVDPGIEVLEAAGGAGLARAPLGRAIAALVAREAPTVVVAPGNHHVPILAAMARALPRRRRPALVCKISNPLRRDDRSRIGQALFGARLRRQVAGFDRLVAMSPALRAEAASVLRRGDIACAAEPSLDAGTPRPRRPVPSGLIVAIGRLTAQKNFERALETIALMPINHRLVILGEGDEYGRLLAHADKLGITDRVSFMGYVPDVRPWLALADALLCTSRFEGYPAAMIEALAAGVPVVTTACSPALAEILIDRSFGAVASSRAKDLAETLEAVIGAQLRPDPCALDRLAARHSLAASAQAWLDLLDETVARHRGLAPARVPLAGDRDACLPDEEYEETALAA